MQRVSRGVKFLSLDRESLIDKHKPCLRGRSWAVFCFGAVPNLGGYIHIALGHLAQLVTTYQGNCVIKKKYARKPHAHSHGHGHVMSQIKSAGTIDMAMDLVHRV